MQLPVGRMGPVRCVRQEILEKDYELCAVPITTYRKAKKLIRLECCKLRVMERSGRMCGCCETFTSSRRNASACIRNTAPYAPKRHSPKTSMPRRMDLLHERKRSE